MAYLPRGIDPKLLLSQIQNTMPYLLLEKEDGPLALNPSLDSFPPAQNALVYANQLRSQDEVELTHLEYFRLCLSAHYLTCATPVPTDVDNQIRQKLWPKDLPFDVAEKMVRLVLESRAWNFYLVTRRFSAGAKQTEWSDQKICGHLGEWFTVICGAYCALSQYKQPEAQILRDEILAHISDETRRHSEIFGSLWRTGDGLGCLRASASIAHNFGDLDRVMDMWDLNVADPLKLNFYKLAIHPFDPNKNLRYLGRLWVAGELYKSEIDGSSMALENHRHYALRKPRCLRWGLERLITIGPFFDEWGSSLAKELNQDESQEVFETLADGWDRQPKSLGYGRAMRGMTEVVAGLSSKKLKRTNDFKRILQVDSYRLAQTWNDRALEWMDEIPSRAH